MGILFARSIGCELHAALQNFMQLFIFPCAGKAGMSRLYLSNPCAFLTTHCTRRCGRSRRPAFPAPSVRERDNEMHSSGENRTVRTRAHVFPPVTSEPHPPPSS